MWWPALIALIRRRSFRKGAKSLSQCFTHLLESRQLRLLIRQDLVHFLQRLLMVSKPYLDVDHSLLIHAESSGRFRLY